MITLQQFSFSQLENENLKHQIKFSSPHVERCFWCQYVLLPNLEKYEVKEQVGLSPYLKQGNFFKSNQYLHHMRKLRQNARL